MQLGLVEAASFGGAVEGGEVSPSLDCVANMAALEAFDVCRRAVLLLDRRGSVVVANEYAKSLLTGDVRISGGKLVTGYASADVALNRAVHKLLSSGSGAYVSIPLCLPRCGQRGLLAFLVTLSSPSSAVVGSHRVAVLLVDPDHRCRPSENALQAAFGFSRAEARLAARVCIGETIESAAKQLGISRDTGRSHLKSIFSKAGVRRQAELVALVTSSLLV
jgi:DNA-binding CsgD family transcriptional regulator